MGEGTVKVQIYKRGQVWWARYTWRGKRHRHSLDTTNKKVAEDIRAELEWKLRRGQLTTENVRVPIADYRAEYRDYSQGFKKPKTHMNDMARLAGFLDFVDAEFLDEIKTPDVMRYFAKKSLEDSNSPTTILRIRETLHAFFAHATKMGYQEHNPVSATPRPRIPERDPRFLSQDQIQELLEAVQGDLIAPLIGTMIYAGLRREEACWLTWADVDLKSKTPVLRIRKKTVEDQSWEPKTKRNRSIPISPKLHAILSGIKKSRTPWVFPSPEGCRWDPDNLSRRLRKLLKKPGLPWNFLDMRHTFGSQLARKSVSLVKIAQLMGNSPEIARKHYIHLIPEEMSEDVEF